jgi:hypothetical protein
VITFRYRNRLRNLGVAMLVIAGILLFILVMRP